MSGEVGGHVIWSCGRSHNQLRLISKKYANDFSRRANEYDDLKGRMVTCKDLI